MNISINNHLNLSYIKDTLIKLNKNHLEYDYSFNIKDQDQIDFSNISLKNIISLYEKRISDEIFWIKNNGLKFSLKINKSNELYYSVSKINNALLLWDEYNVSLDEFYLNDYLKTFDDFFLFLMNEEIESNYYDLNKHPDMKTSNILYKLGLPQDFLPKYIHLSTNDYTFDNLKPYCYQSFWYDDNFELIIKVNHYKFTVTLEDNSYKNKNLNLLLEKNNLNDLIYTDNLLSKVKNSLIPKLKNKFIIEFEINNVLCENEKTNFVKEFKQLESIIEYCVNQLQNILEMK